MRRLAVYHHREKQLGPDQGKAVLESMADLDLRLQHATSLPERAKAVARWLRYDFGLTPAQITAESSFYNEVLAVYLSSEMYETVRAEFA